MPIVLDGEVLTNPVVNQAITDGKAIIEGKMSMDEAKNLAVLLKGGALPVNLKPADPQCEPDFGERIHLQSLNAGCWDSDLYCCLCYFTINCRAWLQIWF